MQLDVEMFSSMGRGKRVFKRTRRRWNERPPTRALVELVHPHATALLLRHYHGQRWCSLPHGMPGELGCCCRSRRVGEGAGEGGDAEGVPHGGGEREGGHDDSCGGREEWRGGFDAQLMWEGKW